MARNAPEVISSAKVARVERRSHARHGVQYWARLYHRQRSFRITEEEFNVLRSPEAGPWHRLMDSWRYGSGWWTQAWVRPDVPGVRHEAVVPASPVVPGPLSGFSIRG